MTTVYLDQKSIASVSAALAALYDVMSDEQKRATVPTWMPDGTEAKSLDQLAVVMGKSLTTTALYVLDDPGAPEALRLEAKAARKKHYRLRRVRTEEGEDWFDQPLDSIILPDGIATHLRFSRHMKDVPGYEDEQGMEMLRDPTGREYVFSVDPDDGYVQVMDWPPAKGQPWGRTIAEGRDGNAVLTEANGTAVTRSKGKTFPKTEPKRGRGEAPEKHHTHERPARGARNQPKAPWMDIPGPTGHDAISPAVASEFPEYRKIHGADGQDYYVAQDVEGVFHALDAEDNPIADAATAASLYAKLNKHVSANIGKAPVSNAAPTQTSPKAGTNVPKGKLPSLSTVDLIGQYDLVNAKTKDPNSAAQQRQDYITDLLGERADAGDDLAMDWWNDPETAKPKVEAILATTRVGATPRVQQASHPSDEVIPGTKMTPGKIVQLPGEKFPPSPQQQAVFDAVLSDPSGTTKVEAKAGAGKTTTLAMLASRIAVENPRERIGYVAFNRSVVRDATGRFHKNTEPMTGHAIARKWIGDYASARINLDPRNKKFPGDGPAIVGTVDLALHIYGLESKANATDAEKASIQKKIDALEQFEDESGQQMGLSRQMGLARAAVERFGNSADDKIEMKHFGKSVARMPQASQKQLLDLANKYWATQLDDDNRKVKLTFTAMRKRWALSRPDFSQGREGGGFSHPIQTIFLDEAQDTPPVLAKVIADQPPSIRRVIVGDGDQAIYGFTGAINYLAQVEADHALPLNVSHRFGPEVADVANRFLELKDSPDRVVGLGKSGETPIHEPGTMDAPDAILVRTNGGGLTEILREQEAGRTVAVTEGTKVDLTSAMQTAGWLMGGKKGYAPPTPHEDLAHFNNWQEVLVAAKGGEDPAAAKWVGIMNKYDLKTLRKLVDDLVELSPRKGTPIGAYKDEGPGGTVMRPAENGVTRIEMNGFTAEGKANLKMFLKAGWKFADPYKKDAEGNYLKDSKGQRIPNPEGIPGQSRTRPSAKNPKGSVRYGIYWDDQKTLKDALARVGEIMGEGDRWGGNNPDVVVTTAHKSKGLEWPRVRIGDDFKQPELPEGAEPESEEAVEAMSKMKDELMLFYVAVTRAERELDPGSLSWVFAQTQPNGGTPGPAAKKTRQKKSFLTDREIKILWPESKDAYTDAERSVPPRRQRMAQVMERAHSLCGSKVPGGRSKRRPRPTRRQGTANQI